MANCQSLNDSRIRISGGVPSVLGIAGISGIIIWGFHFYLVAGSGVGSDRLLD